MITPSKIPVLLFDDGLVDTALRHALSESGCQVLVTTDVESGVRLLRESTEPIVTVFSVSLAANTMTGLDHVTLLGELVRDETLSRRHAFVLVTPTPLETMAALGRVLERTHVTVLAGPLDRERLLSAAWLATRRIASNGAAVLQAGTS